MNGRKTASGEIFDNAKLTAAHKYLPFGTMVKVTNPQNGNIKQGIMKVEYEVLLSDISKEDNLQTVDIQ